MDEVQPLPEPRKGHRPLVGVLALALAVVLVGDAWLLLQRDTRRAPPPGEPPHVIAQRLLDEARAKALAGAPLAEVVPLLDRAVDAAPTLAEARLLRMRLLLPRYLERWAVLDASPLLDRARIPRDVTIDRLRTTMLSDAAALGATSIPEEDRSEAFAIEAFLTNKEIAQGTSPRVRVLRAWRLLFEGRARPAMKECDLADVPEDLLFRWTLAHCLLAVRREEPWRDAMADSAKALLAALPASAVTLLDQAEADSSHAVEILARALAAAPGEASILARLAEAEERAGAFAQALAWASQANDAAPDEPGLLLLRGRLHVRLGQVQSARETYEHVRRLFPDRADVLRARAAFLLRTGDADRALGDAERAVDIDPSKASFSVLCNALTASGQAEQARKRKDVWDGASTEARGRALIADRARGGEPPIHGEVEALEDGLGALFALSRGNLGEAARLATRSTTPDGFEALARVRVAQGRAAEAPDLLRKALAADPLRAPCRAFLGRVLLGLGRPDEAQSALDAAIEIDPTCAEAWRGMGELRLSRGEHQEALKAFDRVVEHGHGDPEGLALRAEVRRRVGNLEGALEDVDRALVERPDHGAWLVLRSDLKLSRDDAAGARADAERATGLVRDSAAAWTALARAALAQGDLDATGKALDQAFLRDPRHVAARVCSARLALVRSQRDKARSELGIALNVDPDDADALQLRAKLAVEDARWQEAADDLERFVAKHPADPRSTEARSWLELARKGLRDR